MKKVYVAIRKEINYSNCYYEGDTPSLDVEYKVFKLRKDALKYIQGLKDCYQWEIHENKVE